MRVLVTRTEVSVDGDPTKAMPILRKLFLAFKIDDAVSQIRQLSSH